MEEKKCRDGGSGEAPRDFICPVCGSERVIFDPVRGEYVCMDCGNVLEMAIDMGPEWRAFTPEQKIRRTRVGSPLSPLKPNGGLSTVIDWKNKDWSGHALSLSKRLQVSRLRKANRMFNAVPSEKNLRLALSEIERLGSQLGIPRAVMEEAAIYYRRAARCRLIKGRSLESMVAACVYAACKIGNVPRSLDEIAKVSKSDRKEISRSYRLIINEGIVPKIPPSKAIDFIPRLVSELRLSVKVQYCAVEIIRVADQMGLSSGRIPEGLAAAAVYLATIIHNERRTQKEVASIANVTEVTIRNRFKELASKLNFLVYV